MPMGPTLSQRPCSPCRHRLDPSPPRRTSRRSTAASGCHLLVRVYAKGHRLCALYQAPRQLRHHPCLQDDPVIAYTPRPVFSDGASPNENPMTAEMAVKAVSYQASTWLHQRRRSPPRHGRRLSYRARRSFSGRANLLCWPRRACQAILYRRAERPTPVAALQFRRCAKS